MTERIETIAALRARLSPFRSERRQIGFVPTMGALHRGHAALIERARAECETVVVSIFVNPMQFDRPDDLDRYPRTLEADMALCASLGADLIFVPSVAEMYPEPPRCTVDVGDLGEHLCGQFRPGHFKGMATVVLKLLQIVAPDTAYFGEKDAQQLAIVRRMVGDFNLPATIAAVEIVREQDGLALSSRNARLSPDERPLARALYAALQEARTSIETGQRDAALVRERAAKQIPASDRVRLEYLEAVDPATMQPLASIDRPVILAGALWVGSTRLIDNVRATPSPRP
jgi:pantoate--beta-alanine ligase